MDIIFDQIGNLFITNHHNGCLKQRLRNSSVEKLMLATFLHTSAEPRSWGRADLLKGLEFGRVTRLVKLREAFRSCCHQPIRQPPCWPSKTVVRCLITQCPGRPRGGSEVVKNNNLRWQKPVLCPSRWTIFFSLQQLKQRCHLWLF